MPAVKAFNVYTRSEESLELTLSQWLMLRLFGIAYIGERRYPGWRGALPFYVFKCLDCGRLHIDYPHGYKPFFLCEREVGAT